MSTKDSTPRYLVLQIRNMGHVPSFKNSKMWTGKKLITKPERQKWMEAAIRVIASQFRSASRTTGGETSTGQSQPSSTAWLLLDDSWQWMPELIIKAVKVPPGDEGADIRIEQIN